MRADFVGTHAGHRLVEQQKLWIAGERHGDFKLALFAVTELIDARADAIAQADTLERRERRAAQGVFAPRVAPEPERMAAMRLHGERDIVERREIAKQRGDLERTRQPQLAAAINRQPADLGAVEADAALFRDDLAAQQADQGGLAGAVRPDDRVHFLRRNHKPDGVGRRHAAEAPRQPLGLQQRVSHGAALRASRRCRRAHRSPPAAGSAQGSGRDIRSRATGPPAKGEKSPRRSPARTANRDRQEPP